MRRFGLIGHPLTHSFSQRYFTDKFQKAGISDCVYENFAIENISSLSSLLKKYPDLEGFNVTIPHKEVILPFLYSKSDVVQEINRL
jgi:shikimate dehydrogenase